MDEIGKTCCTCGVYRAITEYNVRSSAKDGRQSRCRDCSRTWYEANKVRHKANVRRIAAKNLAIYRARVLEYLRIHPCVDCGESDIRCLEFDHREANVKIADVTKLISALVPWARIEAEIAKCDVRCANCHRRVTATRGRWWRAAAHDEQRATTAAAASERLGRIFA